ncbi:hypothetical protein FHR24_001550 [Wenyingzhuangia heitensis]|uniref:Outer membrane protein beta-barrel domain-containing protein n=1 Tax=Wenyingzhuangia heitensis TaxID=1487859 RepID=A0ABX0UC32_9FLAO|nr:DUF6048 family protein [Wenyingzhuangia heitensis]NIJ45111.1 hypothetical protein [Wenyingzhuangia heitensis]
MQFNVVSQEKTNPELVSKIVENTKDLEVVKDSVGEFYNPKTYGLRFGIDIIKPILTYSWDGKFKGGEIVADYRINTRLFIAAEAGYADRALEEDTFNNTVKGSYLKAGINYNLYTNWLDMDNELYLGARYGFASFTNELNNYTIFQEGEYFEAKEVTSSNKYNGLNAHWVEFVAGIKVEVLKNFYLGFMVNINKIITSKEADNLENNYSPGFGKITKTGTGANINYTLTYRIPLYKK